MKIGIIGSGKIGSTVAQLAVDSGHEVRISNSRGPDSLADLVAELGGQASAATVADAAEFGDAVLVATPLAAIDELPTGPLAGKLVIDANNYHPGRDGNIAELDSDATTSTELLAEHLPESKVTKGFNTMNYRQLAAGGDRGKPAGERLALYAAGDDQSAKQEVLELFDEFGFAPIDTGGLADGGRLQQPGSAIYNEDLTGEQARETLA